MMSAKMSNKNKFNTGMNEAGASSEGPLPDRYPIDEQDGPGCHQTSADKRSTRRKWS